MFHQEGLYFGRGELPCGIFLANSYKSVHRFVIFSRFVRIKNVIFRLLEDHADESEHHFLVGIRKLDLFVHVARPG